MWWAITILSLTCWCRTAVQEVPARMLYIWGFLGPPVCSDLKSSVRWNEQWQFIIVIKGEGSQKTSEAWKPSKEKSHGWDILPAGLSPSISCCSDLGLQVAQEQDASAGMDCSPGHVPTQPSGQPPAGSLYLHLPMQAQRSPAFPLLQLVFWAWIQIGNTENSVKVPGIQYILSYVGNLAHTALGRDDNRTEIAAPSWKVHTLSVCGQNLRIFSPKPQPLYKENMLANLKQVIQFLNSALLSQKTLLLPWAEREDKRVQVFIVVRSTLQNLIQFASAGEQLTAFQCKCNAIADCSWDSAPTSRRANLPTGNIG